MNRSQFSKSVVPGLFSFMSSSFRERAPFWSQVSTQKSSRRAYEESAYYAGLGLVPEKPEGEAINEAGIWSQRILFDIKPESELWNIGSPSLSNNGKRLYFTICKNIEAGTACNIYYSEKISKKCTTPVQV